MGRHGFSCCVKSCYGGGGEGFRRLVLFGKRWEVFFFLVELRFERFIMCEAGGAGGGKPGMCDE